MKPADADIVEQTWKRVGGIQPEEAHILIDTMGREQPFLLAYLTAMGKGHLTEDELGLLLHIGLVAWQAMREVEGGLPMVTEEELDTAESKNVGMLEYFDDESDASFYDAAEKVFKNCNQSEIMKYILEALMEEPEEGVIIRDESIGPMFLYLKIVLDAMDR
jgi:hypothetical protein